MTVRLYKDEFSIHLGSLNFKNKQWLSDYSYLRLKLSDDYTGIQKYCGEINGRWILLEHEPKDNTLIYDFNDLDIEEALHRLVEVHYLIGLKEEAKKYASVLGYNYESSQWYENTYALFDKRYDINQKKFLKENKKKSKFTSKIKSLLKLDE